jgi:MFS family permease
VSRLLPPRIRSQGEERNVLVLAALEFLRGTGQSMLRAVWQPFVLSLGASMSELGLLESLGGFRGLTNSLVQPIGGWVSDRRGRKIVLMAGEFLGALAFLVYALAGEVGDWRMLLPGVLFIGLSYVALPVRDSMAAESLSEETGRARAYSLIVFGSAASGVLSSVLAGVLADRWGFGAVLLLGAGNQALCLLLIAVFAVDTLSPSMRRSISWRGISGAVKGLLVPPRRLRSFYLATLVDVFVWGLGSTIFYGTLRQTYGFSVTQLGILTSITYASWAITQLPIGKLIERHGRVNSLIVSELLGVVLMAGRLVCTSFESLALLQILNGLVPATWVPALRAWFADHVSDDQRAEEMGRLQAFRGLLSFPAPYIGGLIFERWGFAGPVLANLIGAFAAALVIWRFVPETQLGALGTD